MLRRSSHLSRFVFTGLFLILSAAVLQAQPTADTSKTVVPAKFHVDAANAGPQDGSAAQPFKTVQQAIDAAANNDVIAVAGGTYPQNIKVQEKAVRLYGGYTSSFKERDPAKTPSHLKGDGKDTVVTLQEAGASVVDGFQITGGGRSLTTDPSVFYGGGIYVYGGAPTIAHNLIEKNQTCAPVPQEGEKYGGGIASIEANISILNNVIRNNVSGRGAGISAQGKKLIIRGNTIENNIGVSDHGGGVYLFSPNAEISHNRIIGNEIARKLGYGWGGGMIVVSVGGNYKLSYNVFTGNFAPSVGSAFFVDEGANASLDHDLFYANACNPAGDGAVAPIYADGADDKIGSTLTVNHITVADHTCDPMTACAAISVTGKSKLTVKNSILWNNGGEDVKVDAISKATVSYTLGQKMNKGAGNISRDPLFADPAKRDYHLRSKAGRWEPAASDKQGTWVTDAEQSPAIDAAEPAAPFNFEPANNGGRANLGAFGNTEQASKSAP